MPKASTIHDMLKFTKKQSMPERPRRPQAEVLPPDVVRVQIEIPHRVFEHFRGDGRDWQKRIARALERAAQGD